MDKGPCFHFALGPAKYIASPGRDREGKETVRKRGDSKNGSIIQAERTPAEGLRRRELASVAVRKAQSRECS